MPQGGIIEGAGSLSVGNQSHAGETVEIQGTIANLQSLHIYAANVNISDTSQITVSSSLPGESPGSFAYQFYSAGGAHGGSAGSNDAAIILPPYGSFEYPSLPGSRGGPAHPFRSKFIENSCYS